MAKQLSPWLLNAFWLLWVVVSGGDLSAQSELVDRVVAVVDEDPILASDLDQIIGLELVTAEAEEDERRFRRRVLDRLIEQRLRFHEIDQFGFAEVPLVEVESQFESIRQAFRSQDDFEARLGELGLDEQGLRQVLARQFMVLIYVEERLGPRVFVGLDDIRQHYEEVLRPELEARGERVPPLQEIREEIRALLKEQRLDEEIESWTEQLRREADVIDYFDSTHERLPPVVSVGTDDESER
ncbi:MAG: hypothetical protein V3R89_07115 [Thermoanaerobaculia bacterium]